MTLRPYQQEGVDEIERLLFQKDFKSLIYCLPTGGGKTAVMGKIAFNAIKENKTVLIITDREELLTGAARAVVDFKLYPHLITAKTKNLNPSHHIYVAMSQTLKRRIKSRAYLAWVQTYFDIIMIDECHKEEFNVFFEFNAFESAKVIGFTATAKRTGKSRQLAQDYQHIVFGPDVQHLISMGYLAMPNYIEADLSIAWEDMRVSKISGEEDYNLEDVAKAMDKDVVYKGMVEKYNQYTPGTMAIVFCSNSYTTIKACKEFNDAGITAKYLITEPRSAKGKEWHQKYKDKFTYGRKQLLSDFANGKFKILVNNGILTTGYDNPNIRTVILDRRTMSDNLLQQMIGRGSRVVKGAKDDFNIIDMADNLFRLGKWHYPREYSLKHPRKTIGSAPVKLCPKCKWLTFASAKVCNNIVKDTGERCNFVFPTRLKTEINVEMKVTSYKELKYNEIKQLCRTLSFSEIAELARQKGFLPNWVYQTAAENGRLEEYALYLERLNGNTVR